MQIIYKIFEIPLIEIKEKLTELIKKRLENIIKEYEVLKIHNFY
jgi:hypothetical protein